MLVTYDPLMVSASVLVAILASFTGLRLASGLRYLDTPGRKVQIVKAAVAFLPFLATVSTAIKT